VFLSAGPSFRLGFQLQKIINNGFSKEANVTSPKAVGISAERKWLCHKLYAAFDSVI